MDIKKLDKQNKDDIYIKKFEACITSNKMISYSDVKEWIGYKQKRSVIDFLENDIHGYILGTDYKIIKEKKEGICKPVNEIYMTINTIKDICITAPTEISQKFKKYYLEMEQTYKENKLKNPISCVVKYEFDINQ